MVTKINLKIEIIVHATEDYQKISDSLCDIFEIESSEITKKAVSYTHLTLPTNREV